MVVFIDFLPLYGLIVFLSVFMGMFYIYKMLKDDIKKNKQILLFYLLYIISAFIFGKIFTMFAGGTTSFWNAGLSSYGGLIGVIVAAIVFEHIIDLDGRLIKYSILSLASAKVS